MFACVFLILLGLFIVWVMKQLFCEFDVDDYKLRSDEIERLNSIRQLQFDEAYKQLGYIVIDDIDKCKEYLLKNKCHCLLNEECVKTNLPKYNEIVKKVESNYYWLGPSNCTCPKCLLTNRSIVRYFRNR